jgi:TIR domain
LAEEDWDQPWSSSDRGEFVELHTGPCTSQQALQRCLAPFERFASLLVYCISGRCHHSATLNGDWLSDETPVRSLCSRMVCTRCGMIGADVPPTVTAPANILSSPLASLFQAAGVSRIFLSHSSCNNAEAVALRDWLAANGWDDEIFLDLDPQRGIAAGERWERALNEAANRCEAVLFLVSKVWLASGWCLKEFNLAHKLNKRLFGVLVEDLPLADLPVNLTSTWQIVRLAAGRDHVMLRAVMPITHEEMHVTFSAEGLQRLKHGLEEAGLDSKYFAWPPQNDPDRPPYRGLRPLEAEDAGIFFGRDAAIVEALDRLRGLREITPPRLLVILGASGAGKSSFLRAGLFPRLARDDRNFLPLPVIRPERAAISGETGLLASLQGAFAASRISVTRADLRAAIQAGAIKLKPLLQALAAKATPIAADVGVKSTPPTLVLSIDQAEELFLSEAPNEAQPLLYLLRDLVADDAPAIIAVFTVRSDNYEKLQLAPELDGMRQDTLSLPPMPKGAYAEVIKGPARRLQGTPRALNIEDARSMRCSLTSRRAAPRMRCRFWPLRWSGSTANITLAATSSFRSTKLLAG